MPRPLWPSWKDSSCWPGPRSARRSSSSPRRPRCGPRRWRGPIWRPAISASPRANARQAVDKNPNQVPPLAALVEILQAVGKEKEAHEAYRTLEPLARSADRDLPVFRRLEPIVARWQGRQDLDESVDQPPANASAGTDETAIDKIDLSTLGPLAWSPSPAEPFAKPDTAGTTWTLAGHKGKNVLVLFFLGGKCAHCMQQLQLFGKEYEALKKLNIDTVAISTDDVDGHQGAQE